MATQVDVSTVRIFASALQQRSQKEVCRALQAVIEGVPPGTSSLDSKLVELSPGMSFPERDFDFCGIIEGVRMKRHRNGGGLVPVEQDRHDPKKPYVADDVYVGYGVIVSGTAKLFAGVFWGGVFWGGKFLGGEFWGGEFFGGDFHGGQFLGGKFHYGVFWGGQFFGGAFWGGAFWGGKFHGGVFHDGKFLAGMFSQPWARYAACRKIYRSDADADKVR